MEPISLKVIDDGNREAVCALSVADRQRSFVAENAKTVQQAKEAPEAWLRAIYAGDQLVGLVLLHDEHLREEPREEGYYFLWRLMVAEPFQGKGYGRKAIDLVVDYVRTRPHAKRLLSSHLPGGDGPAGFYRRCGFRETGKTDHGEVEIELVLVGAPEEGRGAADNRGGSEG